MLLGAGCASAADPAIAPFACVEAVCGFNVLAEALRVPPCQGRSVLVAYSAVSGLSLVQCSSPGEPARHASLLFDRANPAWPGPAVQGTRFIKPDALADVSRDGVPDRFGPVALCAVPAAAAAMPGELLLLKWQPGAGSAQAACYALLRAQLVAGDVVLRGVDGAATPAPSTPEADHWQALVAGLLPWMPRAQQQVGPAPSSTR